MSDLVQTLDGRCRDCNQPLPPPGPGYEPDHECPARSNGKEPAVDLLAGLRNGAWLDAQSFPPLKFHLPGIVAEGSTLFVGPPKVGKSWFTLALALASSSGGRALGLDVEARPTLYLGLEDGHRRMQDRCRTLLAGAPIPGDFQYLTVVQPMTVLATIEAWLDIHGHDDPLVVLDTLGKVLPPALMGESSYARDYRVGSALKRLADERPGSALVVVHHDRKAGSEDFVDRVSGTNGLAGSADSIVVLARARHEQTGTINVTGRDVPEGEYAVQFTGALWQLDGGDLSTAASRAAQRRASEGLDERSRAVMDYVAEHPEGVRFADVKRDLGDAEARYLSRLYEGGRIDRPARGLYLPLSEVSEVSVPGGPVPSTTDTTDTTDSPIEGLDDYEARYPEEFEGVDQ